MRGLVNAEGEEKGDEFDRDFGQVKTRQYGRPVVGLS
jgi:hypothetical protein